MQTETWQNHLEERYAAGEWRAPIFRDLVLRSCPDSNSEVLDIGCGHGFDDSSEIQAEIAAHYNGLIGVEPDDEITTPDYFKECHQCTLEEADIAPDSIDMAYSSFVLEHVGDAPSFWNALYRCMKPNGIFWGFTVDSRHPFSLASNALEYLKLKDFYLRAIQGKRGEERYENYPTHYRCNTPRDVEKHANMFSKLEFYSLHRPGQLDYYFPRLVRPLSRASEMVWTKLSLPGSVLIVKATK